MIGTIERYLYLAAILVIIAGFFLYRHSLIVEGARLCQTREITAAAKQAIADEKIAKDSENELKAEIDRLREPLPQPNPVRVQCYARSMPAAKDKLRTARPGEPATPGEVLPAVPTGAGSGADLGPSLQRFAFSADIVSARDRACLKELKEP